LVAKLCQNGASEVADSNGVESVEGMFAKLFGNPL
jgi:hypothetical protein